MNKEIIYQLDGETFKKVIPETKEYAFKEGVNQLGGEVMSAIATHKEANETE